MKAIKKPLIYFLIWATWLVICLGLRQNMVRFGATIMYMIISVIINFISYYHITFASDKAIKEKEPELYARLENEHKKFPLHRPEVDAASYLLFSGKAKNYPSIRPQIIEYLAHAVFSFFMIFCSLIIIF